MSYTIGKHHIDLHQHHRLLFTNDEVIKLTPTEYQIIVCLLEERIAFDEMLATQALSNKGQINKATHETLERHINNLRSKLRPYGLDIYRVHTLGYILAEEQSNHQIPQHHGHIRNIKQAKRVLAS